jgi:hypothetical protein
VADTRSTTLRETSAWHKIRVAYLDINLPMRWTYSSMPPCSVLGRS